MTSPNYPEGVTERDIDRIGEPMDEGEEEMMGRIGEQITLYQKQYDDLIARVFSSEDNLEKCRSKLRQLEKENRDMRIMLMERQWTITEYRGEIHWVCFYCRGYKGFDCSADCRLNQILKAGGENG